MLRLYDPEAGAVTPVVPARRGQLRTCTAGAAELGGLRDCLLADLVRRAGERRNLLVRAWHAGDPAGEASQALRAAWDALNIHPLEPTPAPPDGLDLWIGGPADPAPVRWLRSAPARLAGDPGEREPAHARAGRADGAPPGPAARGAWGIDAPGLTALAEAGLDPLALRLAFLERPYREPVTLAPDDLAAAGALLRGWRQQVAVWANSPSRPLPPATGDVIAAFDDDLDTPAALRALAALAADPDLPDGAKFESFAYLDRLLGLDLARDIGRT